MNLETAMCPRGLLQRLVRHDQPPALLGPGHPVQVNPPAPAAHERGDRPGHRVAAQPEARPAAGQRVLDLLVMPGPVCLVVELDRRHRPVALGTLARLFVSHESLLVPESEASGELFCRRIWRQLTDARSREAVDVAEAFADGRADASRLVAAHAAAAEASVAAAAGGICTRAEHSAVAACYCVKQFGIIAFAAANRAASSLGERKDAEQRTQCDLFRDIVGNPFRPAALDPAWLTIGVASLAQTIDEQRASDWMPDLADVLESAGCTDAETLAHCRGPGPHVRGCWVVDLISGKE